MKLIQELHLPILSLETTIEGQQQTLHIVTLANLFRISTHKKVAIPGYKSHNCSVMSLGISSFQFHVVFVQFSACYMVITNSLLQVAVHARFDNNKLIKWGTLFSEGAGTPHTMTTACS